MPFNVKIKMNKDKPFPLDFVQCPKVIFERIVAVAIDLLGPAENKVSN